MFFVIMVCLHFVLFSDIFACRTALLNDEFPTVPRRHIDNMLKAHKTLYKTYCVIEKQVRRYQKTSTPFSHIEKARINRGAELILIERGSQLPKELQSAKRNCEAELGKQSFLDPSLLGHNADQGSRTCQGRGSCES